MDYSWNPFAVSFTAQLQCKSSIYLIVYFISLLGKDGYVSNLEQAKDNVNLIPSHQLLLCLKELRTFISS